MLANLAYRRWLEHRSDEHFDQFEAFAREALQRNRRSSQFYMQLGDWRFAAFRVSQDRQHIRSAVAGYRRAVELYPNSNIARAQLAWALQLAGEEEEAAGEAASALRLDELNPHIEQKLAFRQVYDGEQPGARPGPLGATNAEDLMARLLGTAER
jgi:tetratricopeptide (TPR) repeat protein